MNTMPLIENGFATVGAGTWLVCRGQPAAAAGALSIRGLKGFVVPDRRLLQVLRTDKKMWLSVATRPFLLHVTCTERLTTVTSKLLVAPSDARANGHVLRPIPMSFRSSFPVTELTSDWAVMATRSRVTRIVLEENETVSVRAESVVAWTGKRPTGFCPRVRMRDLFFPKRSQAMVMLNFYGPQVVWVEGCNEL